jgi:predicted enzyme involved in methoxymalonyl-ACP biosynthesis
VFLLSCRVLGRKIEDVFLAVMAERAKTRGARFLQGRYLETKKNRLAARFYADRGFEPLGDGLFRLDLSLGIPPIPVQIKVNLSNVA